MKNPSAIGQAINLAAADARNNNRENDVQYIYKRYLIWTDICEGIQSSDLGLIMEVINDREFEDIMSRLKKNLEK
jgi:hypothetical protein